MRQVLGPDDVTRGLRRIAGQIVERHRGAEGLVIVAIRRGGDHVARHLVRAIRDLEQHDVPMGTLDITLHRDDAATALPNPRIGPSQVPGSLDGKIVILVDDVIHTGRTIRAALDALMDYGRPAVIQLATVVDRGGRQLPIQPDYVVRALDVATGDRVDVVERPDGLAAIVQPQSAPSMPPAQP